MRVGDWYREFEEAKNEYNCNRISRKKYESRTRFAIGMIYKWGNEKDKETAERMAKAHGYDIDELVEIVS